MLQGGVARFNPATEKFTTWTLPKRCGQRCQPNRHGDARHVDVDAKSGPTTREATWSTAWTYRQAKWRPSIVPRLAQRPVGNAQGNTVYGVVRIRTTTPSSWNFGKESVGKIDAKTGKSSSTPHHAKFHAHAGGRVDRNRPFSGWKFRANKMQCLTRRRTIPGVSCSLSLGCPLRCGPRTTKARCGRQESERPRHAPRRSHRTVHRIFAPRQNDNP